MNFTGVDRIQNKIRREMPGVMLEEIDVVEWAGEALEAMETNKLLHDRVFFCEVRNHMCPKPAGLEYIIQIARNNKWSKAWTPNTVCGYGESYNKDGVVIDKNVLCPAAVIPAEEPKTKDCEYPLQDSYGRIIGDYEPIYYRPTFDLQYNYDLWAQHPYYHANYTPVYLADHSFFGLVACEEPEQWQGLYQKGMSDEYKPDGNVFRFSFKEGSVAIAYFSRRVDGNGYPLIPDEISHIQAITWYIRWKYMEGKADLDARYLDRAERAFRKWRHYCAQAQNIATMITPEEGDALARMQRMIPRRYSDRTFFGGLTDPEIRTWKTPVGRPNTRWRR